MTRFNWTHEANGTFVGTHGNHIFVIKPINPDRYKLSFQPDPTTEPPHRDIGSMVVVSLKEGQEVAETWFTEYIKQYMQRQMKGELRRESNPAKPAAV